MGYYCSICKKTISDKVYHYSMDHFGKALCIEHQRATGQPPAPTVSVPTRFCSICNQSISDQVYSYSMDHNGAPLCMVHQKTVTPQAIKLSNALKNLDVKHTLEYSDGFKHVDIAIEWAKLYLELDGKQHGFSSKQMCADDDRDKGSLNDGFATKRIPNEWVDENVEKLALSVAGLANKRYRAILENENRHSLTGIIKTVMTKLSEQLENYE